MRHARGQKLQSFRRKWPFYMDLYSMPAGTILAMDRLMHVKRVSQRSAKSREFSPGASVSSHKES